MIRNKRLWEPPFPFCYAWSAKEDDCTSDEYESTWQEMPEDWRSGSDPDYTEDFRSIAKRELKGEDLTIVLSM